MAANSEAIDRQIVPRWRPFREALSTGELSASAVSRPLVLDVSGFMREKEAAWLNERALPFALDLVSAATVLGTTRTAKEAAEFVLQESPSDSSLTRDLASHVLGLPARNPPAELFHTRTQIVQGLKASKARRIQEARNAFVWTDLALLYVLIGQREPARKALSIAMALAPTDRFVVRCTARFLHHFKEYDAAIALLRGNSRTASDPWLIAAEVAASCVAQKPPRFAKVGAALLNTADIRPLHTSELAGALASLELYSGNTRAANRLFLRSIKEPTDNALAQCVWASKKSGLGALNTSTLEVAKAHEALALDHFNRGNWSSVMFQTAKWLDDEAFSARPPLLASSLAASLLEKPDVAEEIVRQGLAANPGHAALVNNLAFALILQGKTNAAVAALDSADVGSARPSEVICLLATRGLAEFRLGNQDTGSRFYEKSIEMAQRSHLDGLRVTAMLYLSRERALRGDKDAIPEFKKAHSLAGKFSERYIPALADHLANDVEAAARRIGTEINIVRSTSPQPASDGLPLM